MLFILTDAGSAYLAQNPVAPALPAFKLGQSYGYTPVSSVTALTGNIVYTGAPSAPSVQSTNLLRYSIVLDNSIGPFSFGEAGLYLPDGTLFAIGVNSVPLFKTTTAGFAGNYLSIDCYIPTDTNVRAAYASIVNSSAQLTVPNVFSVDSLPPATNTPSNAYVVPSPDGSGANLLAVASSTSWTINGFSTLVATGTTSSDTPSGSTINVAWTSSVPVVPTASGQYVLQFLTGPVAGVLRILNTTGSTTVQLASGLLIDVPSGTSFAIYSASQLPGVATSFLSGLNPALTASEVNALHGVDLTTFVKKDGSVILSGPLNFNYNKITNLAYPVNPNDGVNLQALTDFTQAVSNTLGTFSTRLGNLESTALLKTGVNALTGNLIAGGNKITSLANGVAVGDAATWGQVQSLVSTTLTTGVVSVSNLADATTLTKGVSLVGGAIRCLDSIAQLRQAPHTGSPRIFVSGYYYQGDGGGGFYYLDPVDTTSTDNGGSIIVATDGSRWKLVLSAVTSAKQFGAKGDGSANDTTAIQAAVTWAGQAGSEIYVPAGLYLLTATINVPRNVTLRGQGTPMPVAGYNPTLQKSGVVFVKNHTSSCISVVGSGAYSEGAGIYNITVISNTTIYSTGDGFVIDQVGSYVVEQCNVWSCGGNGFSIGVSAGDVTGQLQLRNLYVNNCSGNAYYNRSKWLRAYNLKSDGCAWGLFNQDAGEGLVDGFHFEGFSVGGIRFAGASGSNVLQKGFVALTNAASLYGVHSDAVSGNSVNTIDNSHFVGRSGSGVVAIDLTSSAWDTRVSKCLIESFPVGVNNNGPQNTSITDTIFNACALPIYENGTGTRIRGCTTTGTTGSYSIDHEGGGSGVWTDNVLDAPIHPGVYGGSQGNFGTNVVKANVGFKTFASGTTAAIASGVPFAHGLNTTPATVFVAPVYPYSIPTAMTINYDGTNITIAWTGGGVVQFNWQASSVCANQG